MNATSRIALLTVVFSSSIAGCRWDHTDAGTQTTLTTSQTSATPSQTSATQGTGSVTIAWLAPMQNEDGTPLLNLAGFRIRYGSRYGSYPYEITIDNPGATSHVVTGLAQGLHYFVVAAVASDGQESPPSTPERIVVN